MSADGGKKRTGIHCDKCDVYIPNEASLVAHLKGKKHIKNVERINSWAATADRSLYVAGIESCSAAELELADYFSQFGSIAKITVDKNAGHFAILEFSEKAATEKALQVEQHFLGSKRITVKQREVKVPNAKKESSHSQVVHNQMSADVWSMLLKCNDLNEQFHALHGHLALTDDDIHLRDLLCKLLHSAFVEVFPSCEVQPFGSSVNGFGVHGCDLDLNFYYSSVDYDAAIQFLPTDNGDHLDDVSHNSKMSTKQILTIVSEIIKQCVPDCHEVKAILTARRPVVKFCHKVSEVQCDISVGNALAVRNTMFLRHYSTSIPYLSPLVQAVRRWMKHWNLAGSMVAAGPHLNNYAVTLMVLFYLQNCEPRALETLDDARTNDDALQPCTIEGWDCSFPEASPKLHTVNARTMQEHFSGFFHYYSKLSFSENVLCLKSGKMQEIAILKKETEEEVLGGKMMSFKYGALNIRDPFELSHNVAGNVGRKHMLVFVKCIRNAALACEMRLYSKKSSNEKEPWGILNLFIDHHKKTPEKRRKISNEDSSYTLDILNKTQKLTWPEDTAALIVIILKDVFMINMASDGGNILGNVPLGPADEENAPVQYVAKGQANGGSGDPGGTRISPEARKRQHPTSPASSKRTRLDLSSPEASGLKQRALNLRDTLKFPVLIRCEVIHKLWEGRRQARRQLVMPGMSDVLELERQVSKLLVSEGSHHGNTSMESDASLPSNSSTASHEACFCFDLCINKSTADALQLSFDHTLLDSSTSHAAQEFRNFFHHLETFLPNIVAKCNKVD